MMIQILSKQWLLWLKDKHLDGISVSIPLEFHLFYK